MNEYDGFPSVFFSPGGTQHITLEVEEDKVLVGMFYVPEEVSQIENVDGEIKWESCPSPQGHTVRNPSFKMVDWYDRAALEEDIEQCNFTSPENIRKAYHEHQNLKGFRFEMQSDNADMYAIR